MKKSLIGISLLTAIVYLCTACGSKPPEGLNENASVTAVAVNVSEIEPLTIEQYVSVSSKVSSDSQVSVVPKVGGTVKNVYVSLGDNVKAGDILFEIDDTNAQLEVQQAQASLNSDQAGLESAQANYELNVGGSMEVQLQQLQSNVDTLQLQYDDLLKDLEKYQKLYEIGNISKQELDELQSNADQTKLQLDSAINELELQKNKITEETKKSSQATVEQAQVSLESAQKNLEDTKVRAEIDGTIGSINITKGSTVSAQSEAMTITSLDDIKVSFSVSEDVINRISVGSKVYITISAVSEEPFETVISNISPTADGQTKLYTVEAYLENSNHEIKPGMFASINLVLDKKDNTISVPLNTVIESSGEKYVYVIDENNIAHKTIVETGLKNDEYIEITSGVNMGDKVVTIGQDFLSDGSTVSITES